MRIYLAGASAQLELCASWMGRLRARGHVITYDWTKDVEASRASGVADADLTPAARERCATNDLQGVASCDAFWLLVPPVGRSAGAWLELGYALARRNLTRIAVSGDHRRSIFTTLAVCFDTHDEAFLWLDEMSA